MRRIVFAGLLPVLLLAEPMIRELSPRGAQRGKTVALTLKGSDLIPGGHIETTLPAAISRLAPSKDLVRPDTELPFLVEIKKDAPVGVYPIRLVTTGGISNVMLFSVGEFAEIEENESIQPKESNGSTKSAEKIVSLPVTINGVLRGPDVDFYSFNARAGQKLVFEVEAAAAASAVDSAIELTDSQGKIIARNDDAEPGGVDSRLEHTFTKAGVYYIRIHDSKYSDQAQNFYRLKVGSYPYHEAMFPLGGKRGQPVTVELTGGNLAKPVSVQPDTNVSQRYVPVRLPGSASLPVLFQLSDKPEVMEPDGEGVHDLLAGGIINGRISKKGEVDRYRLPVKAGQEWIFELTAASTGASYLDALMTITDGNGKKLESRDDLGGAADPVIPFTVPKDVTGLIVAVEDLQGRGGPGYSYRLEARRETADFEVSLLTPYINVPAGGTEIVQLRIQRRGYDGGMQIRIPNLPKGFHQAGGTVAPAAAQQRFDDPNPRFGANTSTITITADPDVEPLSAALKVIATADLPGGHRVIREAAGPGLMVGVRGGRGSVIAAPWLEMDLAMGVSPALPAKLSSPVPYVRIAQGVEYPLALKLAGGSLRDMKLRQNIATQVGNLRINQGPPSKSPNSGFIYVNTNFATPTTAFDFLPQVTLNMGGKPVEVYAPIVRFEVVPGYQVWPAADSWKLAAGGSVEIAGTVHREPTFEGGLVKIEVQDLPDGVTCQAVEVPAAERDFRIACQATPAAAKGVHDVRLVSQAPDTGTKAKDTYKGPEVTGKLRVE
jgi:hypothetical protein